MNTFDEELEKMVPPVYAEQGQPRGRKPNKDGKDNKDSKDKKTKRKSKTTKETEDVQKTRNTKTSKRKSKKGGRNKGLKRLRKIKGQGQPTVRKVGDVVSEKAEVKKPTATPPEVEQPSRTPAEVEEPLDTTNKSKRRKKAPKSEGDGKESEYPIPDDCVPAPEGMPTNLIYSKAYSIMKKSGGDVKACQDAGKHASWLMRVKKVCSPALSGPATYNPRPRNVPPAKGPVESSPDAIVVDGPNGEDGEGARDETGNTVGEC